MKKGPLGIVPAVKNTIAGTMARLTHRAWRPLPLRALRAGGAARPPRHHRRVRAGHADPLRVAPAARLRGVVRARAPVARPRPRRHHPVPPGDALPGLGLAAALVAGHALHLHGARGAHRHPGPRRPLRRHRAGDPHDGGAAPRPAEPALLGEPGRAGERTRLARHRRCSRKPQRANPDDRDLTYLLGAEYKKVGRYDEAAGLYRETLRTTPKDPVALNNLANLEFAAGEFPAAIARYKQGIESGPPAARGRDVLLQHVAGPPAALRVPAGAGGAHAGGAPRQLARARVRQPLEVRQGGLRRGRPRARAGRGVVEVRGLARRHPSEEPIRPGARLRRARRRCSPA